MTNIHEEMMEGDRLLDLLSDEQTLGLDEERRVELEELICGATTAEHEREAFERAAASAMVAMTEVEECPGDVMSRLVATLDGDAMAAPAGSGPIEFKPTASEQELVERRNLAFHYAGWFAAAACFVMAVVAWWPTPTAVTGPSDRLAQVESAVGGASDAVTLAWGQWDGQNLGLEGEAEIKGVSGEVVWSDEAQAGYMTFAGLPELDDSEYQLWIIDGERGLTQRISGGVFNGDSAGGEIRVPIDETPIPVSSAAAFAITIEKPGGTWVSDMSRRVVIAARG